MHILKNIFKLVLISIILGATIYASDLDYAKIVPLLQNMRLSTCLMIIVAFMVNFQLVALRNYLAYRQFRLNVAFPELRSALLSGILGGIVPVFGSAISQSISLSKSTNMPPSASILLYFYDKIIMTVAGLTLSLGSLIFLVHDWASLQKITIYNEGSSVVEFCLALVLCLSIVFLVVLPKDDRKFAFKLINVRSCLYVLASLGLSITVWLISTNCFLQCIKDFYGHEFVTLSHAQVFAACSIISFLASLPLSVNGWGVREFAAITILARLLIPAEIALSSALAVGILSTLSIIILAILHVVYANFLKGGSLGTAKN